ncbi:ribosome biogenesis GTP-binding protein YihA/YsxC [Bdellovibrionota bacterium FG-2]
MAGKFIITLAGPESIDGAIKGKFIKGHTGTRIAFVGRSNAGKSSLINRLVGAKIAFTSKTPGKTRAMHFYTWEGTGKILVDLPGYGFAKVSKEERERWAGFLSDYLDKDEFLERALLLLDARHGPSEQDIDALKFMQSENVPVIIVFAKADLLKTQSERAKRKKEASQIVLEMGYDPSQVHWVSSVTGDGIKELTQVLKEGV